MAKNNVPSTAPLQYTVGTGVKFPTPVTTGLVISGNTSIINAVAQDGTANAQQKKQIDGTAVFNVPSGVTFAHALILLPTNFFTSNKTYRVLTQYVYVSDLPGGWPVIVSTVFYKLSNSFSISVSDGTDSASTSAGVVTVDWFAIGY